MLRGKLTDKTAQHGHEALSTFGVGGELSESQWRAVLRQLLALGHLRAEGDYNTLVLTRRRARCSRATSPSACASRARRPRAASGVAQRTGRRRGRSTDTPLDALGEARFDALRAWRAEVAREHNLPAYVVFHDATLAADGAPSTRDAGRAVRHQRRRREEAGGLRPRHPARAARSSGAGGLGRALISWPAAADPVGATCTLNAFCASADPFQAVPPWQTDAMNNDALPLAAHADDDDLALMAAFAAGDARAFEWLYQRHHAPLYRFVRRLLGRDGAVQADEVFQDTWLRVVNAKERYVPLGASFRTWLFTLAHHRAIDVLRRSGREVALPEDDAGEPFVPEGTPWSLWPRPEEAIDELVFWRRAGAKLLECLEQLPVAQKTAFLLHHEDGISLDELARALDIGFETAKSRLRYSLAKLRTCMGAYLDAATLRSRA